MENKITALIRITGIVQGVGFRPFVYNLAVKYNITGLVLNDDKGVYIEASAHKRLLKKFIKHIKTDAPPQSKIDSIHYELTDYKRHSSFTIALSQKNLPAQTMISPDLSICKECEEELFNNNNHRYLYPYINCTNCGPRYSIIKDIPYDRKYTVMNDWTMCIKCNNEYTNPVNRRFHAEPVSCFDCGPKVQFLNNSGMLLIDGQNAANVDKIFSTISKEISNGKIIAIKGIGGFHLVCDASNKLAVSTLRERKHREEKPFAIMVSSLKNANRLAHINRYERQILQSVQKPIVLLLKKHNKIITTLVAPNNKYIGIMLPYTPIHYLLFYYINRPLVMTSANISDDPIEFTNNGALERLNNIADYFLIGERKIYTRSDDSVVRIFNKSISIIRRARGFVPLSVKTPLTQTQNVLSLGAEQKNTICLLKNGNAILSQHIGDIKNVQSYKALKETISHLTKIFEFHPSVIAADMHPSYLSTQLALSHSKEIPNTKNCKIIRIQHHHAHAVSCMAENNLDDTVLAVVLDGTGYGNDDTIWGGEILSVNYKEFTRIATFKPIQMPSGELAIKEVWRMGLAYLYAISGEKCRQFLPKHYSNIPQQKIDVVIHQLSHNINTPITTSCGRLFDGVSAITGVRMAVSYEGQAAIELEQIANNFTVGGYKFNLLRESSLVYIDYTPVIKDILNDGQKGTSPSVISMKFHSGLVKILAQATLNAAKELGLNKVVLSGGCFMNTILLRGLVKCLQSNGLNVYTHTKVPCNDGGIALGQAVIANALTK